MTDKCFSFACTFFACLLIWAIISSYSTGASDNLGLVLGSSAVNLETSAAVGASSAKYPNAPTSVFRQIAMDKHNTYRTRHGAGPLKWSNSLAASAGATAAQCRGRLGYGMSKAGENVYATSARGDPVRLLTNAIDSWYQQSSMYDFDKPGFSAATRHFTQASACDDYYTLQHNSRTFAIRLSAHHTCM